MAPVTTINSFGGPYLALPEAALSLYPGAEDADLYEQVSMTRGAFRGVVTKVLGFDAIVLGTPDPLAIFLEPSGAILARLMFFEHDSQELFDRHMRAVPDGAWKPCAGGTIEVAGPWFVFDSGASGASARTEGLALQLSAGTYEVSNCEYKPGEGAGYQLVRLRRTG